MIMHGVCSQVHMIRTLRVLRLQRLERQKGACHEKGNNHGDGCCFSRVPGDVFLLWSGYDQGGHCGHLHGTGIGVYLLMSSTDSKWYLIKQMQRAASLEKN
jgi:hypothetical protein